MVAELVLQPLDVKRVARCRRAGCAAAGSRTGRSSVCASTRKMSDIGAEQNHLWPVSSYSRARAAAVQRRARRSCWRARPSRPASRSSPCRRSPSPSRGAGIRRGSYVVAVTQRLPLGRQLGLRAQRRHDREGHRDRAGEARLGLHRGHVQRRARRVRERLARSSTAASAARARRPCSSACATPGGTRPRRCGCRSGRACCSTGLFSFASRPHSCCGSPPTNRPERRRALAHPAGALALGGLDQRQVAREHVDALQRRRLVGDRVRLPRRSVALARGSCETVAMSG